MLLGRGRNSPLRASGAVLRPVPVLPHGVHALLKVPPAALAKRVLLLDYPS